MKRILEELYLGNIRPSEQEYTQSSESKKMAAKVTEISLELQGKLDEDLYAKVVEIIDLQDEMLRLLSQESFIRGFRMGMQMAIESIYEGEPAELKDIT